MNLVRDNCLFPAETEKIWLYVNLFVVLWTRYMKICAAVLAVSSGRTSLSVCWFLPVMGLDLFQQSLGVPDNENVL